MLHQLRVMQSLGAVGQEIEGGVLFNVSHELPKLTIRT